MNLANKLTILRLFLIIPFITLMSLSIYFGRPSFFEINPSSIYLICAGVVFVIAMATDALDGHIARSRNQITNFGKLFDPLADKFMTTSAFILLTVNQVIPVWVTIIFVLRDILVDGSRNIAAKNNVNISASWWGKWKTIMQSIGLTFLMFLYPFIGNQVATLYWNNWELALISIPIIISLALSIISGTKYFLEIKKYINK